MSTVMPPAFQEEKHDHLLSVCSPKPHVADLMEALLQKESIFSSFTEV